MPLPLKAIDTALPLRYHYAWPLPTGLRRIVIVIIGID